MNSENIQKQLEWLNIEDLGSLIFIFLGILNIYGDLLQKKFIISGNVKDRDDADKVYLLVLIIAFLLYSFFFYRNYRRYKLMSGKNKQLFSIKLLSSALVLAAVVCSIYFQINNKV